MTQENQIHELIAKAAKAEDSGDAMRFSQAAQNATNALTGLCSIRDADNQTVDFNLEEIKLLDNVIYRLAINLTNKREWSPEDRTLYGKAGRLLTNALCSLGALSER